MENNIYKTISALLVISIASIFIYLFVFKNKEIDDNKNKNVDLVQELKNTNTDFKAGADALDKGDNKAAVAAFTAAIDSSTNLRDQAVSQYNLANAKMISGDRYEAISEYLKIINNEQNSPAARSLAMNQVYLFYKSYSDVNILQQAFGKQDISSLSLEDAEYAYVMKAYNLYPFAITIPKIMMHQMLNSGQSSEEIQNIYKKYSPVFDKSILEMGSSSGQKWYVVNSMLGKAKILMFMEKYNLSERPEIEALLDNSIQRARDLKMGGTEQFALLEYANYESSIGDIAKSDALIAILSKMTLTSMVKENMAGDKAKTSYAGLLKLKIGSKNTTTQAFFKVINW